MTIRERLQHPPRWVVVLLVLTGLIMLRWAIRRRERGRRAAHCRVTEPYPGCRYVEVEHDRPLVWFMNTMFALCGVLLIVMAALFGMGYYSPAFGFPLVLISTVLAFGGGAVILILSYFPRR